MIRPGLCGVKFDPLAKSPCYDIVFSKGRGLFRVLRGILGWSDDQSASGAAREGVSMVMGQPFWTPFAVAIM